MTDTQAMLCRNFFEDNNFTGNEPTDPYYYCA